MAGQGFAARLLAWYDRHGRRDLPWRRAVTPYRVWVSEIMLQQTRVSTAIPFFERFVARFPDVASLAAADEEEVLAHWAGLGYYARARNLHRAARRILADHGGELPRDPQALQRLPGIGRSTAGAILSIAFEQPAAILDGNVRRVLARHAGVEGWPGSTAVAERLWRLAEERLPASRCGDYSQALMDLGAVLCTRVRPVCAACPVSEDCLARRQGRQTELPAPRPARTLPVRRRRWLLVLDAEGRLLFERRPPEGLWGGLWAFPELAAEVPPTLGGWRLQPFRELPARRHAFSHFVLEYHPLLCRAEPQATAEHPGRRWAALGELHRLPLPAPVRALAEALFKGAELAD
ncbi:MAG: A/G-specific adenine glycosylase [Porticoccaceae bacterium]|nr:MAG: A/G-specific adenine glycosylase [Porticoccaceae bacterium]